MLGGALAGCHLRCAPFSQARSPCAWQLRQSVQRIRDRRSRPALRAVAAAGEPSAGAAPPKSAKEAVESGLDLFQAGDSAGALSLFLAAQQLRPNADESRAALYNAACAYTKLGRWAEASAAVVSAVNDYDLRLAVALKDADLERLRETREWSAALASLRDRGGLSEEGYVRAREEIKAPFRLFRIFLLSALAVGDTTGLFFSVAQLIGGLRGGDSAPELQTVLQNLAINGGVLAVLGFFLARDLAAQARDRAVIEREEALGRLLIVAPGGRSVALAALRGNSRPIILAGSRGQVARALAAAEPFYEPFRERGVSLVPLVTSADDPDERIRALKEELKSGGRGGGSEEDGEASASGSGKAAGGGQQARRGFRNAPAAGTKPAGPPASALSRKDRKWTLEVAGPAEWVAWLESQKAAAGVTASGNELLYVQVQLDGSVRASGKGVPPFRQFIDDIPPLDDIRTKVSDGAGMM